jgi:8-amino-7-oxononanoate synthase
MNSLDEFLKSRLAALDSAGLRRSLRRVMGAQGPRVDMDGREVLNFCSNNYLGLAGDPRLAGAAMDSLKEEGFGSGASRLVCGSMDAHRRLERAIADFKGTEACLLFSSGYMANVGIISSLFGKDDLILSDRLNHASIIDGIRLSGAKLSRYPHCDMEALESRLRDRPRACRRRAIITDSVFSMDGDIAPLDRLVELAGRYDCVLMIDEAHALGVFGENGKGLAEHFGVGDKVDIQMGTLSKAAGAFGAYCCGPRTLIDFLMNQARSFIYTTAMPPSVAAAGAKAVEIMAQEKPARARLWENASYMLARCKAIGFDTKASRSPVIPLIIGDPGKAAVFSRKLLDRGIFIGAIRPPTVPPGTARLRLTVMAGHTREELDFVLKQLEEIGRELCLL